MRAGYQGRCGRAAAAITLLLAIGVLPGAASAQAPTGKEAAKEAARPVPRSGARAQAPRMVPIVPEPKQAPAREPERTLSVPDQYCRAVLEPAREARFAHQTAELQALGKALD